MASGMKVASGSVLRAIDTQGLFLMELPWPWEWCAARAVERKRT